MDEQYNQLREEMREQQKSKIATVKDSEMKLHRLKAGFVKYILIEMIKAHYL